MEIHNILKLVRKWFWLLILAILVGGAAGLAVNFLQPKVYEATATLFVSSPNHSDANTLAGDQQAAKALALFPLSNTVLSATLRTVDDGSLSLTQLTSMVSVDNNRDTQFVDIHVRDSDPNRAARLASEIARQSMIQFEVVISDEGKTQFLQQEIERLGTEITNLENQLHTIQKAATPSTENTAQTTTINTNLSGLRTMYSALVNSYVNLANVQVTLLQDAQVPKKPIGLGPLPAIAIGMLAGLIVIIGVIVFVEQTDNIVRTPAKVAQATSLSTLITVRRLPAIAKRVPQKQAPPLNHHQEVTGDTVTVKLAPVQVHQVGEYREAMEDTPRRLPVVTKQISAAGVGTKGKDKALNGFALPEAFLTLGVLLQGGGRQLNPDGGVVRLLLITSPENGDGKTLIASQLALGMVKVGVKVILVDANLRNPRVHSFFRVANSVGLSSMLTGKTSDDSSGQIIDSVFSALQQTHEPKLRILPGGPRLESPSEALLSPKMTAILQELSKEAFVVVDSPAVLTSSESVILADNCDSILMVVNAQHTTAPKLNQAVEILERVNANMLGVVLNRVGD